MYQTDVSNDVDNKKSVYLEIPEAPFKEKCSNHVRDGKHERYCNTTEVSKYAWELKRDDKVPIITWKIARKVYGNPKHKFWRLFLLEKLLIINFPNQDILVNKRYEFGKCRFCIIYIYIYIYYTENTKYLRRIHNLFITNKLSL